MKILFILFVLLFSFKIHSEILFENKHPNEHIGIWSHDCSLKKNPTINEPKGILKINEYSVLWIDDYGTMLSFSKTSNISGYTAYKFYFEDAENENNYSYNMLFAKKQNDKLTEKYEPNMWNKIDYDFLEDPTYENVMVFEKCEDIPTEYKSKIKPLTDFLDSEVPNICFEEGIESNECFSNVFSYADVHRDGELSVAELTRLSKIILSFVMTKHDYLKDLENQNDNIERFMIFGIGFTFSPTLSQLFIMNYDYDNSNSLSLQELQPQYSDFAYNISNILKNNYNPLTETINNLKNILK